jgi:hypothetical protein
METKSRSSKERTYRPPVGPLPSVSANRSLDELHQPCGAIGVWALPDLVTLLGAQQRLQGCPMLRQGLFSHKQAFHNVNLWSTSKLFYPIIIIGPPRGERNLNRRHDWRGRGSGDSALTADLTSTSGIDPPSYLRRLSHYGCPGHNILHFRPCLLCPPSGPSFPPGGIVSH